ncbi:HD domain-containing protein [Mucilaginibacter sp. dw_454]|uniref:HD domain-containing protein n=1 Tax=Mucilaginibacter sp. dw_454 TaxID=2720079 RepID=UPI001BD685E1|nr:HD domain-containing protein [Mucilaginibacter sp. dw_454]
MPESHLNNYYGSILDPLHGDIKLSEIEKWILAQPIFSRLRKVKQNSFLYYVFPSSNHTRFEHSVGVMHTAGRIYNSCKENYNTGIKKAQKYFQAESELFFDLDRLGTQEGIFYQELRLAALLHDIGHGPMSHLFDSFAISKKTFLDVIENDLVVNKYRSGFEKLIEASDGKVEHELISCLFVFYLIDTLKKQNIDDPDKFSPIVQQNISNIEAERIVKMIEPKFVGITNIIDDNGVDYTSFFSRIITAFPIDADRMDYFLRDSYFAGVTYGIYDINRIFSSFIPIIEDQVVKLGYKESGSDSMLRFIQSRSHLYNQIYFHKTNRGANLMLTHSTLTLTGSETKLLDDCEKLTDIVKFYVDNGDEFFLRETIKKYNDKSGKTIENEILNSLINRKLFKRIYRKRITISAEDTKAFAKVNETVKEIRNKLTALNADRENNTYSAIDLSKNENYKDSGEDKAVLLIKKGAAGYEISDKWLTHSLEFKNLNLITLTVRIYIKRTFNNSKEFEKISESILSACKSEIKIIESIN